MDFGFIFIAFLLFAGGVFFFSQVAEKKRREALAAFAASKRWRYSSAVDRNFPRTFHDFESIQQGSNRYARHVMSGSAEGVRLTFCEYHYETTSHNSKGGSHTTHHWHTLLILEPRFPLKDLRVRPEGIFDKLATAFGGGDINFESAEFSRRFHVSAPERSWAYAVIQPPVMELLLRQPRIELAMNKRCLMLKDNRGLEISRLPGMLHTGTEILAAVPGFARSGRTPELVQLGSPERSDLLILMPHSNLEKG